MGYKQKQQGKKKKATHQEVRGTHQRVTTHSQKKKLIIARKYYEVQKLLGRPIKKYNLLYSMDNGDWFSSEDKWSNGYIKSVLNRMTAEHFINCGGWSEMYQLKSHNLKDNQQFFMYANLSNDRSCSGEMDKFEYFTWKETFN